MAEVLRSLCDEDTGLLRMRELERDQQYEVYQAVYEELIFCMGATTLQGIWESALCVRLMDGREVAFRCIFGEAQNVSEAA
jgi:hypothetical protein